MIRLLNVWSWVFILLWSTQFGVMADVKLKRISADTAFPGSWTTLHVHLENNEDSPVEVELSVLSGQLDQSISGVRWPITLPAKSHYQREIPLFMTPSLDPKESKSSRPSSRKKSSNRNFSQRSFKADVQLLRNGAVIAKDTVQSAISKIKPLYGLVVRKQSTATMVPKSSWPPPIYNSIEPKIMGENLRVKTKTWPALDIQPLNASALRGKRILWMEESKECSPSQFRSIQHWISEGGLLILDATQHNTHFSQQLWGYQPTHSQVGQLTFNGTQTSPLWGFAHQYDQSWSQLQDDEQHSYGAQKSLGLGRVVILDFSWTSLVSDQPKLAAALLQSWLPESLNSIIKAGKGQSEALLALREHTGQKVWGKTTVALFLISLLVCAVALSFLGPFRRQAETRWLLWMGLVFLWTGAGLIIYLVNSDLSTRSNSMAYRLRAPDSPWAQEWGAATIISGEKRRFPLSFDDRASWSTFSPMSWIATINQNGVQWSDFSLLPQIEKTFTWNKTLEVPLQSELKLKVGKRWSLSIPKGWNEFKGFLVVGRRYWKIKGNGQHVLDLNSADSMQIGQDMATLPLSIFIAEQPISTTSSLHLGAKQAEFNLSHQVFLIQAKPSTPKDWGQPEDVIQQNNTLELWRLTPEVEENTEFTHLPGIEDWSFTRAGETRRSFRGFDGVHLPVLRTLDMTLSLPSWLAGRTVKPRTLSLCFTEPMKPADWKVSFLQNGKDVNLTLRGQEVKIPIKAWKDQNIQIKVKSRARASVGGASSPTQVFPLLGLKWDGVIQ